MKTTTNLFKLLTLFVTLFQNCTKDQVKSPCGAAPQSYYIPIKEDALAQTPYFTNTAFDTISFVSDKGDTLTFVKTKTDTSWYFEHGSGSPDCGYDNMYSQTLHNTYATIKGNGSFDVMHIKKRNGYEDLIQFNFLNLYFFVYDDRIGLKDSPFYVDSILINNNYFYAVSYVFHNFTFSNIGKTFYNKKFGLIQIEDKQNITNWTIIN